MSFSLLEFFADLFRYANWVFLSGGYIAILGLLYEWIDDQWLDNKIGSWFGKQEYVFYRVFPPVINEKSFGEMEQVFQRLCGIYKNRDPYEVYTEGKWYEGYSFEFHSKGGHVGIFIRVNKKYAQLLKSAFEAHLDGTILVEYPDPLANWPKDWDRKTGDYTSLYGTDMTILSVRDEKPKRGKNVDYYQLRTWRDFQTENERPKTDPAKALFTVLSNIDPEEYLVVQFYLEPQYNRDKINEWKAIFQEKKQEFSSNEEVDVDAEGNVSVLTDNEKLILDGINRKIHSLHFSTKIRFLAFANSKVTSRRAVSLIYSYFAQFHSPCLVLVPDGRTVTSVEPKGEFLGILGPQISLLIDKIYYARERYFREKCIYQGLIRRSGGVGSEPYFLTPEELAAMIHFPYVSVAEFQLQSLLRQTQPNLGLQTNPQNQYTTIPAPQNLPG